MLLAIDPGIETVAWAMLDDKTGKLKDCGIIRNTEVAPKKQATYLAMAFAATEFLHKIKVDDESVTHVIIEWLSHGCPHVGSACGMSAVVGAIADSFRKAHVPVITVFPQTWKKARTKKEGWARYMEALTLSESKFLKGKVDECYKTFTVKAKAEKAETDLMDAVCLGKYLYETQC